jgi:hypothetical protein
MIKRTESYENLFKKLDKDFTIENSLIENPKVLKKSSISHDRIENPKVLERFHVEDYNPKSLDYYNPTRPNYFKIVDYFKSRETNSGDYVYGKEISRDYVFKREVYKLPHIGELFYDPFLYKTFWYTPEGKIYHGIGTINGTNIIYNYDSLGRRISRETWSKGESPLCLYGDSSKLLYKIVYSYREPGTFNINGEYEICQEDHYSDSGSGDKSLDKSIFFHPIQKFGNKSFRFIDHYHYCDGDLLRKETIQLNSDPSIPYFNKISAGGIVKT